MPPERKQLFDVVRAKDERNRLNAMSMEKWTQLRTMRTEQNKIWRSKMGVKDKYTKQVQDAMNKRARRFFFECEEAEKLRLKYQAVVEEKQWECVYNKIIAQFPKCVCISRCTTVDSTIDSMDVDQANNEDDMSVSYNNFSFAEYFHHDNEMDGDGLL